MSEKNTGINSRGVHVPLKCYLNMVNISSNLMINISGKNDPLTPTTIHSYKTVVIVLP
jgi:hypothetical protein